MFSVFKCFEPLPQFGEGEFDQLFRHLVNGNMKRDTDQTTCYFATQNDTPRSGASLDFGERLIGLMESSIGYGSAGVRRGSWFERIGKRLF
ncbi:hypothetical protein NDN08_002459 [Rhodosorus marinus]|uniref:Uncharacterized protein n=1 Tax=Rhodosorus marinus TaxID=101924 RepID=A0AAV8UTV7_9RHOD|nr:hypothetical protein NDN08_002459 [Rhodosorus marinus]